MASGPQYNQYGGGYYQPPPQGQQGGYYNNNYNNGQNYSQPPQYGDQNAPPPPPQVNGMSEKPSFDQAFAIQKPKWNDVWAGLLVWFESSEAPFGADVYSEPNLFPTVLSSLRGLRGGIGDFAPGLRYGERLDPVDLVWLLC